MSEMEVLDIFLIMKKISLALEKFFNMPIECLIEDGVAAGKIKKDSKLTINLIPKSNTFPIKMKDRSVYNKLEIIKLRKFAKEFKEFFEKIYSDL